MAQRRRNRPFLQNGNANILSSHRKIPRRTKRRGIGLQLRFARGIALFQMDIAPNFRRLHDALVILLGRHGVAGFLARLPAVHALLRLTDNAQNHARPVANGVRRGNDRQSGLLE